MAMEMPCSCIITDQYLPLQGGERSVQCPHAEYIVKGERTTAMRYSIVATRVQEEDGDEGEPE